jgi:hypothetical protein
MYKQVFSHILYHFVFCILYLLAAVILCGMVIFGLSVVIALLKWQPLMLAELYGWCRGRVGLHAVNPPRDGCVYYNPAEDNFLINLDEVLPSRSRPQSALVPSNSLLNPRHASWDETALDITLAMPMTPCRPSSEVLA